MTGKANGALSVLGRYVDGLHVSVFGEPCSSVFEDLRSEKGLLRASPRGLREFRCISGVPGGPLMLTTEGGSRYQFVLRNGAVSRLEVTSRGHLPKVMIQFRANILHDHDLKEVDAVVERIAGFFLEPGFEAKVSRFDLAVDFQAQGWEMPERKDIITRLEGRAHDEGPARLTGRTFGSKKGPLQVEIYDKTARIAKHPKEGWVRQEWAAREAYDEWLPVFRVEVRFFRNVLRQFKREDAVTGRLTGVDSVSDLNSGVGDLVRHVLGDADANGARFLVASPDTRKRRSDRRRAAPWWEEIVRAFVENLPGTGRVRRRSASSGPDLKRARSTALTALVQTAAWERARGPRLLPSPEKYLGPALLQHLPAWLEAKGFGSWGEAVDFEVKKLVSSGKVPYEMTLAG